MKNWKHGIFAAVFLLIGGVFYVNAQDIIVLKDGNMIEAKVLEISTSEIKYKRFNHLDGPTIVVSTDNVLSVRYENGITEIINAEAGKTKNTTIDQDKFIFGINANGGGALGYVWKRSTGAGINIELGKGHFNTEINLMFPSGGFGILFTFNGFWPSRIGGFYLGGGGGYSFFKYYRKDDGYGYTLLGWLTVHTGQAGLNIGYKFITKSGIYFRTGIFAGVDFALIFWPDSDLIPVYIKPDLAIGWTMR